MSAIVFHLAVAIFLFVLIFCFVTRSSLEALYGGIVFLFLVIVFFFSVLIVFVVAWSCCKWCTALSAAATVQGPKHAASLFWEEKKKRKHNCGTRLLMLLLLLWFLFEFNHRSTLWMKNSPPIQLKIHNSFNFWATAKKCHFIIISFLHVLTRREGCWWNNYF